MIIEEEEQFDLLPYKWTQDQDYINIRFPLMEGETFENEDAVQITNNEEHGHLFALSDGDAGRTVVDVRQSYFFTHVTFLLHLHYIHTLLTNRLI